MNVFNSYHDGSKLYYSNDEINYNFIPGHTYYLIAPIDTVRKTMTVRIYDEKDFDNLQPNPDSPNATPFDGKWQNVNQKNIQLLIADGKFLLFNKGEKANFGIIHYEPSQKNISLETQLTKINQKWVAAFGIYVYDYDDSTLYLRKNAIYKKIE